MRGGKKPQQKIVHISYPISWFPHPSQFESLSLPMLAQKLINYIMRISFTQEIIHLHSYRTCGFHFLKQRNMEVRIYIPGSRDALRQSMECKATPEHPCLLQTCYCCAAQCLGAARSKAVPVPCIYPTNCTSHLVWPGQAQAVCSSELV